MAEERSNGARWWMTWAPVAAALVVAGGAIISFFVSVEGTATAVSNLQAQAENEKEENGRRLGRLESALQAAQIFQASQKASDCEQFAKIETQFGTVETVLNKNQAEESRDVGALRSKVFGELIPSIYYPVEIPHEVVPCQ